MKYTTLFFIFTFATSILHASEYKDYLKSILDRAEEVPVKDVYTAPIFKKGSPGYKFRSEIKRQVKMNQVNFAGKWSLVVIGCGTGCGQYYLVESKTGKVIDPKLTTTNGLPFFVKWKNVLITTGSIEASTLEDAKKGVWGGPKAWTWNGKSFEEMAL